MDKMEKPTGGTWTDFEWSPRPLQLREYALKKFWEIFVDVLTRASRTQIFNLKPSSPTL